MAALRRPEVAPRASQRLLPHALGADLLGRCAADEIGPARLDAVSVSPSESNGTALGVARRRAAAGTAAAWFELGKADNGKRFQVPVGQWVLVRLAGNPTTGFEWQTAAVNGQAVRLAAEPQYVATPVKPNVVGGGGTYYFKFRAMQPGVTTIKLIYLRPWLKDQPPLDSFRCTVEVLAPKPAAPKPHS